MVEEQQVSAGYTQTNTQHICFSCAAKVCVLTKQLTTKVLINFSGLMSIHIVTHCTWFKTEHTHKKLYYVF